MLFVKKAWVHLKPKGPLSWRSWIGWHCQTGIPAPPIRCINSNFLLADLGKLCTTRLIKADYCILTCSTSLLAEQCSHTTHLSSVHFHVAFRCRRCSLLASAVRDPQSPPIGQYALSHSYLLALLCLAAAAAAWSSFLTCTLS